MSAGQPQPGPEPGPPGCQHWVQRKKRACRMSVRAGRRYCGEHEPAAPAPATAPNQEDPRIPCPLDPKHTCYASKLSKHLLVCNAKVEPAPAYISRGCNSAPSAAGAGAECRVRLQDVSAEVLSDVIQLIETLYKELVADTIEPCVESEIHGAVREAYWSEERARSSRRHLQQTSSLIQLLEREGLVRPATCFVELGAGKGHVSYYLSLAVRAVPSASVLLVDRASHRHKQDNKLDGAQHRVARLRADINHLLLGEVDAVRAADKVVAVSKHLCGMATDFALRCITAAGVKQKACGVVMATCCHHRCTAESYVATNFLKEHGITKEYFDVMMGVVSWATCGTGFSRERRGRPEEHAQSKRQKTRDDTTEQPAGGSRDTAAESQSAATTQQVGTGDTSLSLNNDIVLPTENKNSVICSGITGTLKDSNLLPGVKKYQESNCNITMTGAKESNEFPLEKDISVIINAIPDVAEDYNISLDLKNNSNISSSILPDVKTDVDSSNVNTNTTDARGLGLSVERRTAIGRRAKALLDYGRAVFLRECGFSAKLCYYVDVSVSPENVCIVAKKS